MRVLWGCLAATVIAPIAGVLFLIMIPVWRDNDRLADFHERVLTHPLPPETRSRDNGQAAFGRRQSATTTIRHRSEGCTTRRRFLCGRAVVLGAGERSS